MAEQAQGAWCICSCAPWRTRQVGGAGLTWRTSLKTHKAPAYQAVHIHCLLVITAVHLIQLCSVGSVYADVFWAVKALQCDLGGYLALQYIDMCAADARTKKLALMLSATADQQCKTQYNTKESQM